MQSRTSISPYIIRINPVQFHLLSQQSIIVLYSCARSMISESYIMLCHASWPCIRFASFSLDTLYRGMMQGMMTCWCDGLGLPLWRRWPNSTSFPRCLHSKLCSRWCDCLALPLWRQWPSSAGFPCCLHSKLCSCLNGTESCFWWCTGPPLPRGSLAGTKTSLLLSRLWGRCGVYDAGGTPPRFTIDFSVAAST